MTFEFGSGELTNLADQAPSIYANAQPGSRNQLLFLASELQAAGMSDGNISSVGFHVAAPSGTTFLGFSVKLGTTVATELTAAAWEPVPDVAWGPADFMDTLVEGWTQHVLSTPFFWDGLSNLVIEACYTNGTTSSNAQIYQTNLPFTAWVTRNSPNGTICSAPGGTHIPFQRRADTRLMWTPLLPMAAIGANSLYCQPVVSFVDASLNDPTEWDWDFGDGTTDTIQNPTHTYPASGVYTVVLIVSNAFGSDTAEVLLTVDLDIPAPASACPAASVGAVEGFGIMEAVIEGVTHTSADASTEGYADNTCAPHTVVQGTYLDLSVSVGIAASHAVRAWLDVDNSGTFTANELLLSGNGPNASSSTLIGSGSVLNTPLRLRIIAAYDLVTPSPQACGDVQFGQAEDYSVIVIENTLSPTASFSASPLFNCTGMVQFTDLSQNIPTGWTWDFGDSNGSTEQNPIHTYGTSGTYSVTLLVINANGQDDTLAVDLITIDLESQLLPAACAPNTSAYCCGYGLLSFDFAGIGSTSPDGSEGYQDRSCGNTANVTEGQSYVWTAQHNPGTSHDTRIWIDLNNDGAFAAAELMATVLDQVSPTGSIIVPSGAVLNTPLRLRVVTDVIGQPGGACDAPFFGQAEDFSVVISPNTNPPTAAFIASPTTTCDGVVQFTDLSTNMPTGWSWNFGDGGSSDEQNPIHTYADIGTYSVTLTVTNANGSDAQTQGALIQYVPGWQCDTLQMQDNASESTACLGVLADDGGPQGPYSGGTSGAFTISPASAEFVTLDFSVFQWGNSPNRWLRIYDGPDVASPLIGQYQGNGLGMLPNGGIITSTGPSITLRQEQQVGGGQPPNTAGFVLTWNCSLVGIEEVDDAILNVRPQPADGQFAIDLAPSVDAVRTVVLRDALGRTMEQRAVAGSTTTLWFEVASHPAGSYALQVIGVKQAWSRIIIIQ